MALDPATVRRIASLARIRVEDNEVATLQGELNGILGWIEQLNEVNVDGIAPLTGAAAMAMAMRDDVMATDMRDDVMATAMRDDIVTDGGYPEKVLANAPGRAGAFYAVPKVVE